MAIVERNGTVSVEYSIPAEIEKLIPEYFYYAMAGELFSIMGFSIVEKIPYMEYDEDGNELPETRDESQDYYDLDSSTGGWYEAFRMTCHKLNLDPLYYYYESLEWYDSDIFDGIIESRIIEKVFHFKYEPANAYYKYLCDSGLYQHKTI